MSQSYVYGWVERWKEGLASVVDGRPSTATYVEVEEQIDQSIRDNRRIGIYEI
jgi:hypothetical protein